MTQTMAQGVLPSVKLARTLGGFRGVPMIPPATKTFVIIASESGMGKSGIFHSIPDNFVFNDDLTSVSGELPAIVWPGVDPDTGRPIEECLPGTPNSYVSAKLGGRTVRAIPPITWKDIQAKEAELLAIARDNPAEAPQCITHDTVDSVLPLLIDWALGEAIARDDKGRKKWDQFDGRALWEDVYGEFVRHLQALRSAGYGIFLGLQIGDRTVAVKDQGRVLMTGVPLLTDNFMGRFVKKAEYRGTLFIRDDIIPNYVEQLDPLTKKPVIDPATGKPRMIESAPTTVRRHYLSLEPNIVPGRESFARGRGNFRGTIMLPDPRKDPREPWATIAAAYNKSINP